MPILLVLLLSIPSDPVALCAMTTFPEELSPAALDGKLLDEVIGKRSDCMPAHYLRAWSLLGEDDRDMDLAIEHLESAAELAPGNSDALGLLGQVYLMRASEDSSLSDARNGRDTLEKAIETDPEDLDARSLLASFHRNAPWIAGGDMDEAEEQAAEIRKRDLKRGILEQARNLRADGQEEAALALAMKTLETFPAYAPLAIEYAFLVQEKEDYAEAHRVLHAATREDGADLNLLYQLGRNSALSGQFLDDGRAAMQRYLVRGDADEPLPIEPSAAWWRLGMIEQHAGDDVAARVAFERSLQLDPEREEAAQALETLSP